MAQKSHGLPKEERSVSLAEWARTLVQEEVHMLAVVHTLADARAPR